MAFKLCWSTNISKLAKQTFDFNKDGRDVVNDDNHVLMCSTSFLKSKSKTKLPTISSSFAPSPPLISSSTSSVIDTSAVVVFATWPVTGAPDDGTELDGNTALDDDEDDDFLLPPTTNFDDDDKTGKEEDDLSNALIRADTGCVQGSASSPSTSSSTTSAPVGVFTSTFVGVIVVVVVVGPTTTTGFATVDAALALGATAEPEAEPPPLGCLAASASTTSAIL
jgi:hypothetical protein